MVSSLRVEAQAPALTPGVPDVGKGCRTAVVEVGRGVAHAAQARHARPPIVALERVRYADGVIAVAGKQRRLVTALAAQSGPDGPSWRFDAENACAAFSGAESRLPAASSPVSVQAFTAWAHDHQPASVAPL
jgi:hypothetical protein